MLDLIRINELEFDVDVHSDQYGMGSSCLRFGKLNLICVTDPEDYKLWKDGTEELKRMAPVTRDQAIKLFRQMRAERKEHEVD
jgi:hypothetical protein